MLRLDAVNEIIGYYTKQAAISWRDMVKKYLEDSSLCKVTFSLSKEAAISAETVHLVG